MNLFTRGATDVVRALWNFPIHAMNKGVHLDSEHVLGERLPDGRMRLTLRGLAVAAPAATCPTPSDIVQVTIADLVFDCGCFSNYIVHDGNMNGSTIPLTWNGSVWESTFEGSGDLTYYVNRDNYDSGCGIFDFTDQVGMRVSAECIDGVWDVTVSGIDIQIFFGIGAAGEPVLNNTENNAHPCEFFSGLANAAHDGTVTIAINP